VRNMSWFVSWGELTQTFFAAAKIGAILAVINPAYGKEELEFALRTVRIAPARLLMRNEDIYYHTNLKFEESYSFDSTYCAGDVTIFPVIYPPLVKTPHRHPKRS
jgi:acyl-CoA synthetase (AMP-forming)/AMP-acid ligase II